jgi:GT2 family glycosyltransferase
MYRFSFVILHYLTENDTVECVDSIIRNVDYEHYNIIIVDNGSGNRSGENLSKRYSGNGRVTTIINQANLGFAKGNNIGFDYAKHRLKSDFIALLNNDTIIEQRDFIHNLIEKYDTTPYHILGPDIVSTKDGRHQNPCPKLLQSIPDLKKHMLNNRILLVLNYLYLDKFLERLKKYFIKKPLIVPQHINTNNTKNEEIWDAQLHASCLIFSPLYIEKYEGLYSKTYMYSEEAILYFIAKRDGLDTIYYPQIKIYHKEDSSTDHLYNKTYKKRRFYLKNFIRSGNLLLKLMQQNRSKT